MTIVDILQWLEGTALANPDFAALAAAYGCHAERVERDRKSTRLNSSHT